MRKSRITTLSTALRLLCVSIILLVSLTRAAAEGVTAVNKPTSALVPNIHPMARDYMGQNYTVNGYLEFQMECLGESKDYDYWFFAGVGGDAHTQVFTADPAKFCNCLSHIDFSPEIVKTWYDAVGYDFTIITEEQFNADRPRYVGELMKFIDRGIPIIAKKSWEARGDFCGDFWLLIGYEESGSQLVFVTDNTRGAENNHFKVPTNEHVNYQFILPGAKKQAPPLADVYRKAALKIPELLTQPKKGDVSFGRAAFEAWADHLLAEDYAGKTDEQINSWKDHCTYVCILSTNAYGPSLSFLDRAAKLCPDLPFLADVKNEYVEIGGLVGELDAAGGNFNITPATFRSKEAKRPIAAVLRRMGAHCDRIVEIYRENGYKLEQQARVIVADIIDHWEE